MNFVKSSCVDSADDIEHRHAHTICTSASVCMSVCLSICLSAFVCVCQSVCLSVCQSVSLSVYLHVCQSVSQSVCLSVTPTYPGQYVPLVIGRQGLLPSHFSVNDHLSSNDHNPLHFLRHL